MRIFFVHSDLSVRGELALGTNVPDTDGSKLQSLMAAVRAWDEERHAVQQKYALLSPREREVMQLVIRGRLNKHIAAELGIAEITVKTHRGRVMRKMRANSVPHLVTMSARLLLQPQHESQVLHVESDRSSAA
jgi:DNA-binding CsgD family transcriptional regulator